MSRFAIVDLSNLFSRARHVVQGDPYTKAGMALSICFSALRRLHRDNKVDHIVFASDYGSWRYDVFPGYKASRRVLQVAKTPRDAEEDEVLRAALADFTTYLTERTRCTVLRDRGIEADDMVARWTQIHPDDEHIILSSDSDFLQLLGPKVRIYDGMNERMIAIDGVRNNRGVMLPFTVDSSSGKLKVRDKSKAGGKKLTEEESGVSVTPEPEWWRHALFVKIVRGDSGDGIFPAYPGITYKGTSKRTGIAQAWADRNERGFHWNNFFQSTWEKAVATDDESKPTVTVKVAEQFRHNELLIDLTCQPEPVKAQMDAAIAEAICKKPVGSVGIHFLKFCSTFDLPGIAQNANDHAAYLNAPYPLDRL